jgi:uncharacterized membrane protein YjjP (DUF1212 family)
MCLQQEAHSNDNKVHRTNWVRSHHSTVNTMAQLSVTHQLVQTVAHGSMYLPM